MLICTLPVLTVRLGSSNTASHKTLQQHATHQTALLRRVLAKQRSSSALARDSRGGAAPLQKNQNPRLMQGPLALSARVAVLLPRLCCSVLQSVAECCRVLQSVAVCCGVLQCAAMSALVALLLPRLCCSVLQCVAVCCSVLQCVAVCFSMLQCVKVDCSALH